MREKKTMTRDYKQNINNRNAKTRYTYKLPEQTTKTIGNDRLKPQMTTIIDNPNFWLELTSICRDSFNFLAVIVYTWELLICF